MNVTNPDVSNGCGGKGWDSIVAVENYLGNVHTYKDGKLGTSYTVDFKPACDLHDAGYAGLLVEDGINGGARIDYRGMSRTAVDSKFLRDLRALCHTAATPPIPPAATDAMRQCEGSNLPRSIGAATLHGFVDDYGDLFFDADLTAPGLQEAGDPKALPKGGARDNGPPKCTRSGLVGLVHRRASTRCSGAATTTAPTPARPRPERPGTTQPADPARTGMERHARPASGLRWRAKDASGRVSFLVEIFESDGKSGARVYSQELRNQPVDPGKYPSSPTPAGSRARRPGTASLCGQPTPRHSSTQLATIKVA